jgi:Predicted transcriptional regulator
MKTADDMLSILTFSEQRKGILFFLQEKPRTLTDIKEHFDVKSANILPRLREMEAANLILRDDGMYKLTIFGEVAAVHYKPFLDALTAIESNQDFWSTHDLSAIPKELFYRVNELSECRVIKTNNCNLFESHKGFSEILLESKFVEGATCVFNPRWIKTFLKLAQAGTKISLIITEDVYEKIKDEYFSELKDGLDCENAKIFVTNSIKAAFIATDKGISLSLNFKNGTYDPKEDLMGSSKAAIRWMKDLFKHYNESAIEVKNILPVDEAVISETYSQSLSI